MAKYLQIRLSEEDEALINELVEAYQVDRSTLVRLALGYVRDQQPVFTVVHAPTGRKLEPQPTKVTVR